MGRRSLSYNHEVCDRVLSMFDVVPSGFIEDRLLDKPGPADKQEVLSFLVAEGLLEKVPGGYHITYKGRMIVHGGGFKKAVKKERLLGACTVIAAVSSLLAIIFQIVSHFSR